MKKVFSILLAIALAFASCAISFGSDGPKVIDNAGVFDSTDIENLESYIDFIISKYGYDIAIYTDCISDGRSNMEIADEFYDSYGLGSDENLSGTLLFINFDSNQRGWWTTVTGDSMNYFDEDNINVIDDAIYNYMVDGDYFNAMYVYLECVDQLYESGSLFVRPGDDDYDYYYSQDYGEEYVSSPMQAVVGALPLGIFGFLASFTLAKFNATRNMKSIKKATSAENYKVNGSFKLFRREDIFRGTTIARVPIAQANENNDGHNDHHTTIHTGGSSFSGGHFSSGGGGFHSGGGRSF